MSIDGKMGLNGGGFQWRGRMGGTGSWCLFSPPDVREVGQFICPVHDPLCPFGTVAPSFHPGMGVQVALGTSLSLRCSRALPVVGVGVGQHVPAASSGLAAFPGLLLGTQDGVAVHSRGAEAQNGAETSPVLFALGLDASCYCLFHLLATGEQDIH